MTAEGTIGQSEGRGGEQKELGVIGFEEEGGKNASSPSTATSLSTFS